MRMSQLSFGSLLSYCPRGGSDEANRSNDAMLFLKKDSFVNHPPVLMSQWIANTIKQNKDTLPFSSYFQSDTVLVPTPKSSLMQPNTLWVPHRIANAIVKVGLAKQVIPCLERVKPVSKAATSQAKDRPKPADHYRTISVQQPLNKPNRIVLIDDVITRGSTLLGAANRLADVFPDTQIVAFAAMRTISNSSDFNKIYDPCIGEITLRPSGDTLR